VHDSFFADILHVIKYAVLSYIIVVLLDNKTITDIVTESVIH